jgi:hypothetical protein
LVSKFNILCLFQIFVLVLDQKKGTHDGFQGFERCNERNATIEKNIVTLLDG